MKESCHHIRPLLERMAEGSLPGSEQRRAKQHLAVCQTCREYLEKEIELNRQLRGLPVLRCPDRVEESILRTVMEDRDHLHRITEWLQGWNHWRSLSLGLAMSAAILIILFLPSNRRIPPVPPEYSQEEIKEAREKAIWTLAYVSQTMQQKENSAVSEIFGHHIPKTLKNAIENSVPLFKEAKNE